MRRLLVKKVKKRDDGSYICPYKGQHGENHEKFTTKVDYEFPNGTKSVYCPGGLRHYFFVSEDDYLVKL